MTAEAAHALWRLHAGSRPFPAPLLFPPQNTARRQVRSARADMSPYGDRFLIYTTVSDLLDGRIAPRVEPSRPVEHALSVMEAEGASAVLVCNDGVLVGILTERDVIRNWRKLLARPREVTVAEIMRADPVTVLSSDSLASAQRRMKQSGHRHLPVMRAGRPIGLLSYRDIPAHYRMMFERFTELRGPQPPLAAE